MECPRILWSGLVRNNERLVERSTPDMKSLGSPLDNPGSPCTGCPFLVTFHYKGGGNYTFRQHTPELIVSTAILRIE